MEGLVQILEFGGGLKRTLPISLIKSIKDGTGSLRRLKEAAVTKRGSGYTDTEIAQSNTNIQASFTGDVISKNGRYKLNWGKGIAKVDISAASKGIFSENTTAVTIGFNTSGYDEIIGFKAVATVVARSDGKKELNTLTVSEPGVYIPRVGQSQSFEIVIDTVTGGLEEESPDLTPTLANYLNSVEITGRGGGISVAAPKLTLDTPGARLGNLTLEAAVVDFTTETFTPGVLEADSDIALNIGKDTLENLITQVDLGRVKPLQVPGKEGSVYKGNPQDILIMEEY